MKEKIEIPDEFEAKYEDGFLTVEGNGEEVSRKLEHALVDVNVDDGEIEFSAEETGREIKSIVGTFKSHAENMVEGLKEKHSYSLKGVYAHFPMDISVENQELVIENFMGERNPRRVKIEEGVKVKVDGEEITVEGSDKEAVGLTAGRIEQASKKGNRDPRTFQDGIYITSKGGGSE